MSRTTIHSMPSRQPEPSFDYSGLERQLAELQASLKERPPPFLAPRPHPIVRLDYLLTLFALACLLAMTSSLIPQPIFEHLVFMAISALILSLTLAKDVVLAIPRLERPRRPLGLSIRQLQEQAGIRPIDQ